jgi:hypothetical protein
MRHIIEVYTPDAMAARYEGDDASPLQVGDRIVIEEVAYVIASIEHEFTPPDHVTRVTTGRPSLRALSGSGEITNFLRYHVLVRVFDGDIAHWLRVTRNTSDATFLRSLQQRLATNPALMLDIREVVDSSGLWPCEPDA